MYSFTEIEMIFKNSASQEECLRARAAFAMVFDDKDISNRKLFFVRKKQRARMKHFKK